MAVIAQRIVSRSWVHSFYSRDPAQENVYLCRLDDGMFHTARPRATHAVRVKGNADGSTTNLVRVCVAYGNV